MNEGKDFDSQFSIGDVVMLKSGGPKMTVVKEHTSAVECCFFDAYQEVRKVTLSGSLLARSKT